MRRACEGLDAWLADLGADSTGVVRSQLRSHWTSEHWLYAAVIMQAVTDCWRHRPSHAHWRDALGWLAAAIEEPGGSAYVCDLLGLDLSAVIRAATTDRQRKRMLRRVDSTQRINAGRRCA